MTEIKRQSPVRFNVGPIEAEVRDNWTVALEYDQEGQGPWLVDLAHKTRWDLQHKKVGELTPCGLAVPADPGACTFADRTLVNRMNRTQASIWHLSGENRSLPDDPAFTEVVDATVFLALLGKNIFAITEKLSTLDFVDPIPEKPFLLQGPFSHVPCQIVALEKTPQRCGILMTCSRGYAGAMMAAILDAGEEFGLRSAGENAFSGWIGELVG